MGVTSLLRRTLAWLRVPGNELGFAVRSRLRWSRGPVRLPSEDKRGQYPDDPALRRSADRIAADYDLANLRANSTLPVWMENVAMLDRLGALAGQTAAPAGPEGAVRALDVGCGPFQYATALQRWLSRHGARSPRAVCLRGIEIDGHGVYRDGHSRADHARAHAALAGDGTTFEVADFTRLEVPPQDVVSLFYPFLSAYPLLRWGSPISHLGPARLLGRAVRALRAGGWLVVANQTATEFERLRALLEPEPVKLLRRVSFASPLVPWRDAAGDRVGSLWVRDDSLPNGDRSG